MGLLSDAERAQLLPAEDLPHRFPIPTQIVSSDEYFPEPQTAQQKQVEDRLAALGDHLARRQGISRRRFFQTASGMAAAFLAMNQVYGTLFDVTEAEAATPEQAQERAIALSGQDVFDAHTHFLRDDTRLTNFVAMRAAVGKAGWNAALGDKPQTIADLKFDNYFKEVFLDSDTKVALLTNSPSDIPEDWFLTNDMVFQTRDRVNRQAGARRLLAHYTIVPGQPGWLEGIDHAIADLRPDGWKGYTVGDNTHKDSSRFPWRLDDEKLMYPAYEKFASAGIRNVCIHKGLFPPSVEKQVPNLRAYADVSDVGRAAKDWPQLNFVVYHSGYRHVGGSPADAMAEWDQTGRSSVVRLHQHRRTPTRRRPDGHADQRARLRPRHLGHRCGLDRGAAMADRGVAAAGDPRGHAGQAWFRPAGSRRWTGQAGDLRAERLPHLRLRPPRGTGHAGPLRGDQAGLPAGGRRSQQPALRLCQGA
jgi:hypothetical protein